MNELQTTEQTSLVPADVSVGAMQSALAGDLSKLTEPDRLKYYGAVCQTVGLNPLTKPFDWIVLNGKLTLYANKGCAEQLRAIHKIEIEIVERKVEFDCFIVRVKATHGNGRHDESLGAVPFKGLSPLDAANAMMKCETKAKRRVSLSICGLGMLDESELDQVKGATQVKTGLAEIESTEDIAAALNAEQPSKTITVDAQVVSETPKGEPVKPAEPVAQPAPKEEAKVATPTPEIKPGLDDAFILELQTIFGENVESVPYLLARGRLTKPPDLRKLDRKYAGQILKTPKKFFQNIEQWVKAGKPVEAQP